MHTAEQGFDLTLARARAVFEKKLADYGPCWLVFRFPSLLDQIFVKLKRLRTLEETENLIGDTPEDEYLGIINYCLIGLLRIDPAFPDAGRAVENPALLDTVSHDVILAAYDREAAAARALMLRKNHDYGGAWADMAPASITDQLLIKILRARNLVAENRAVPDSDHWTAQLTDTINYCVFAMILRENERAN